MQPPAAGHLRCEHPRRRGFLTCSARSRRPAPSRCASTPAGRSPAFSTAATRRTAVPGSAMSPVITSTRRPRRSSRRSPPRHRRWERTPVEDNHSRALLRQPLRDDEAEPAHAAHHDVPAVTPDQWLRWRRRDRLMLPSAGIEMTILPVWASGCHQPECVDGLVEAELGDRKHLQFAVAARAPRIS